MRRLLALPLALALLANQAAQTRPAARPCITGAEVEGLALVALPEVIRSTALTCRPHLPAGAILLRPEPLAAKYQAEAAGAWPMAVAALGKIVDPQARQLLSGEMGRTMLPAMIGPMIAAEIKPADCGAINRGVELLQPLPARNTAGLLALILQLAVKPNDRKLNVCPYRTAR